MVSDCTIKHRAKTWLLVFGAPDYCGISKTIKYRFPGLIWKLETGMSELSWGRS